MSAQFSYQLFVKSFLGFLICLAMLSMTDYAEARLYKWVDETGNIKYGDQLPPEYMNKKHFQLDQEGRVIKKKEAGKSPEQLKKERALTKKAKEDKAKKEAELERQRVLQNRQDRILLLTFNSEDDIFYSRDQRLQVLDTKTSILNKNRAVSESKLMALLKQAEDQYTSKNVEIPGGLQQKIEQMHRKIETTDKNIDITRSKRAEVISGFKKDLARFRDLKARQRQNKQ